MFDLSLNKNRNMKKSDKEWNRCEELSLMIEVFLEQASPKYKRDMGKILCQTAATFASVENENDPFNMFDPLKVLSEAQTELQSIIADFVDEDINKTVHDYIKK